MPVTEFRPVDVVDRDPGRGRASTTTAAGVLMLLLTAGFGATAALTIVTAVAHQGPNADAISMQIAPEATKTLFVTAGSIVLVTCAMELYLAIGVLRRKEAAREGALFMAGALAVISLAIGTAGLLADNAASGALWGVLTGLANVVVFALLWHPSTRSDVSRAEHVRQRRRPMG